MTAAALVGASVLASFPAAAQEMLPPNLCSQANDVAYAIMSKYPISPSMATSFNRFRVSKCDLDTDFNTLTPVDEQAFGEFRVKLIALKKMASVSPSQLVAK